MLAHAALGLVGWDDSLRVVSPRLWRALRAPFAPLERVLAPRAAGTLRILLRLTLAFARGEPRRCEPLVTTGTISAADLAAVRYLEPEIVVFGFVHVGGSEVWSDPVRLEPGHLYELKVHMGSLYPASDAAIERLYPGQDGPILRRRYRLLLDGREVLAGEGDFDESRWEQVVVGKNYIASQHCGPEFRGRILEVLYDRSDDQ